MIVANDHAVGQTANVFRITSYFQEQVSFIGQKEPFEEGSETIQRLMGVDVGSKQIQRVSEHYGQCLEENIEATIKENAPLQNIEQKNSEPTYAMADGAMVLTNEEGWKEMKLGRVFQAGEDIAVSKNRHWIKDSKYCAYLGNHELFLQRFELLLNNVRMLVFIADGAKWFWEWATTFYPKAIQILDYYHCKEYLCEFAQLAFSDSEQKENWIQTQEDRLFNDEVETVISSISSISELTPEAQKYQQKILTYYQNNKTRMLYGTYRKKKLLIGSGPIESAHRNVVQKRLKLSGQRWSNAGAQKVVNLRVAHKSNQWSKVVDLIQGYKKAA